MKVVKKKKPQEEEKKIVVNIPRNYGKNSGYANRMMTASTKKI